MPRPSGWARAAHLPRAARHESGVCCSGGPCPRPRRLSPGPSALFLPSSAVRTARRPLHLWQDPPRGTLNERVEAAAFRFLRAPPAGSTSGAGAGKLRRDGAQTDCCQLSAAPEGSGRQPHVEAPARTAQGAHLRTRELGAAPRGARPAGAPTASLGNLEGREPAELRTGKPELNVTLEKEEFGPAPFSSPFQLFWRLSLSLSFFFFLFSRWGRGGAE